jgi:20S proteasome alpha/beta subunit
MAIHPPFLRQPQPARPLKQVYDTWWRAVDMTLCIGALAQVPSPMTPCVVLCFDYMGANDYWGSEGEYKLHVLSEELVALAAGSIAQTKELAMIYKDHLKRNPLSDNESEDLEQLRKPLSELKRRRAEAYVRRRLAVGYREFLANGARWFGEQYYDRYLAAIEKHQPNVEMILAGFSGRTRRLYEIRRQDGTGSVELQQATNFCLIGTGALAAEPVLHARKQTANTPMSQAVYNIYEAKKTGETSPWVGERTRCFVLLPAENGEASICARVVTANGEKWLKRLYRSYGPRPMKSWPDVPKDAFEKAHFTWPPH